MSYFYLNNGAHVVLVGKDEEELKMIASEFPTQATVVVTNVTDDQQCKVSLNLDHLLTFY
jgi:NADP-dependent 3-hydroxy acid dehydrogenase YdfG